MISKLNDKDLHLKTIKACKAEKVATILLLVHLHEVNRRKLFVDHGHSTLQKYMLKELGFSEGECWIRIQAKRVVLERSKHKCEHPGCTERRNLQFDHLKPFALGGDRSPNNIRPICFGHNQRRAIKPLEVDLFEGKIRPLIG